MNGLKEFVVLWQILDYQGVDSILWLNVLRKNELAKADISSPDFYIITRWPSLVISLHITNHHISKLYFSLNEAKH